MVGSEENAMKVKIKLSSEDREELELLVLEISELRGVLREISQQVIRIERRVRAILPHSGMAAGPRVGRSQDRNVAAKDIINHLTKRVNEGVQIENELRRMTVKHELVKVARELGMTNRKLPPKDALIRGISARIRQRASVADGIRKGTGE